MQSSDINKKLDFKNFVPYKVQPEFIDKNCPLEINIFQTATQNTHLETVKSFGDEWAKFDHFSEQEINIIAKTHYFDIVPQIYVQDKKILDVGCGTGRWSKYIAKFALSVDAIDPSDAIYSASKLLGENKNIRLSKCTVDNLPFEDESFDFVFSLGVLHHIPDTALAMKQCVEKLKPGGHFLTYLYYDLDNRGRFFRLLFEVSNVIRKFISKQPSQRKNFICDFIAVTVYMPFIGLAKAVKLLQFKKVAKRMPLSFYVGKTFNVIRNDARDRFGTPLEQRFTKSKINEMMTDAGLENVVFSENETYWHAIGKKMF